MDPAQAPERERGLALELVVVIVIALLVVALLYRLQNQQTEINAVIQQQLLRKLQENTMLARSLWIGGNTPAWVELPFGSATERRQRIKMNTAGWPEISPAQGCRQWWQRVLGIAGSPVHSKYHLVQLQDRCLIYLGDSLLLTYNSQSGEIVSAADNNR